MKIRSKTSYPVFLEMNDGVVLTITGSWSIVSEKYAEEIKTKFASVIEIEGEEVKEGGTEEGIVDKVVKSVIKKKR